MKLKLLVLNMFLLCCAIPSSAAMLNHPAPMVQVSKNPKLGDIFTDNQGMALYFFTVDEENKSNCYGPCAKAWPPLLVEEEVKVEGDFGKTTRSDGALQITYKGKPLYYFFKDKNPGDTNGQNVEGKWFVVKPNKE